MKGTVSTFIEGLTNGEAVGILLFVLIDLAIIGCLVGFRKNIVKGLEGANQLFEVPEVLIFVYLYTFPSVFVAACAVPTIVKVDVMGWMFMMVVTLFGLTGRWGLEWLLAFRNNKDSVTDNAPKDDGKGGVTVEYLKSLIDEMKTQMSAPKTATDTPAPTPPAQ